MFASSSAASISSRMQNGGGFIPGGIIPESLNGFDQDGFVVKLLSPLYGAIAANPNIAAGQEGFAMVCLVTYILFSVVVGLALFLVIRLIMIVFSVIAKLPLRNRKKKPNVVSRLAGFVISGVKGAAYVFMIFLFIPYAAAFVIPLADQVDNSFMSKYIFEYAVAPVSPYLFTFDVDKALDKIAEKAELGDGKTDADAAGFEIKTEYEMPVILSAEPFEIIPGVLASFG